MCQVTWTTGRSRNADTGLTHMGHAIAKRVGITMLGRASGKHYPAFTGKERLKRTSTQPTALA